MFKRKNFWIIVIIVLAVAGVSFYYLSTLGVDESEKADEPDLQTAMASRGDIVIYASGTGQIIPVSEVGLSFDESGTLIKLNVEEGQNVKIGEVLARLETEQSAEDIAALIAEAELAVIKAENARKELYATAEDNKTQALTDIDTYTQAVRDANYSLYNYTMPVDISSLTAKDAVAMARRQLDAAIEAFTPYRYLSEYDSTREKYLETVNKAQALYDAAIKRQNYEYTLEVAEKNLNKAQQEYEKYKDGPPANELAEAEGELLNAQASLDAVLEEQAIIDLISPMDGIVLSVDTVEGIRVNNDATVITLADLSKPRLEVFVDETDLDLVSVGKEAEVVFDALPDKVFTGEVVLVSPELVEVSNVMAVRTLIVIDEGSLDPITILPAGLGASVDIIYGKAENVILVPVEALRDLGDGDYAVFVVDENNELKLRAVEIGLMDVTSVEIINGLEIGEVVSTGIVATK